MRSAWQQHTATILSLSYIYNSHGVFCSENRIGEDEQADADFTVPLQFRINGSPNGKPDLQLQLLRIDFGSEVKRDPARQKHGSQQLLTIPSLQGTASHTYNLAYTGNPLP